MNSMSVRMEVLVGKTRDNIPQDSNNILTESNDTVLNTNHSLGNDHNTKKVMSPEVGVVCVSQEMMASHDNPHFPSI